MTQATSNLVCLACSVFRDELEILKSQGKIEFPIEYLDSMLHIHPEKLRERLDSLLATKHEAGDNAVLLFGDCHAHMCDSESSPCVSRVRGCNCAEILLGHDRYQVLRREGAFILLPEWTIRWREIFNDELGLSGETRREFMRDMHKKLTYLDTGIMPVPMENLTAASDAMGLPWEIERVGLDCLLAAIREAVGRVSQE